MADDLQAEQTPGFKVGEKKTMEEYQKLGRQNHHPGHYDRNAAPPRNMITNILFF